MKTNDTIDEDPRETLAAVARLLHSTQDHVTQLLGVADRVPSEALGIRRGGDRTPQRGA